MYVDLFKVYRTGVSLLGKGKRNKEKKSSQNKKETEEIFFIRENHEIIDINDFWEIHQIMRSDFYLLDNLKLVLENQILSLKNPSKDMELTYKLEEIDEKVSEFYKEILKLKTEYIELDNAEELINKNLGEKNDLGVDPEVAISKEQNLNVLNFERVYNPIPFFETYISCIKLSEKIESKSNDILQFLYMLNTMNNEILSKDKDDSLRDFSFRKRAEIFKYGFDVSTDRDKIINYEIKCDDNNTVNILANKYDLKKTKIGLLIEKRDLRYINSIIQNRVIVEFEEFANIFKRNIELERNRQAKILNRILFYIAVIAVGSQLLNLPEDYSSFYEKLRPYLGPIQIKGLAIGILILIFIIIFVAEKLIFKETMKNKR